MHLVGKPLGDVAWFHEDLATREEEYFARQVATECEYGRGPKRLDCILCKSPLTMKISYQRMDITFIRCDVCGHMNGSHLITDAFVAFAYEDLDSEAQDASPTPYEVEFSSGRMADYYDDVVGRIYGPKVDFLVRGLSSVGIEPGSVRLLDAGCGSGHFVAAARDAGFCQSHGFDSLESAIVQARLHGHRSDTVWETGTADLINILRTAEYDLVSMMCVLPHLQDPCLALKAMRDNPNVRFTFQKLPMWSFATILESATPGLRARVLGTDHTHVFTLDSLSWLERNLGMKRIASWSFGSDALDLQRKLLVLMQDSQTTPGFRDWVIAQLQPMLEDIQLSVDVNGLSSEIHVLWQFD